MRENSQSRRGSPVVTIAFGTTAAMWVLAYICMLGPGLVIGEILFGLMALCLLIGGMLAGRETGRAIRSGADVGALSATLNLLIVGSLFGGEGFNWVKAGFWIWGTYAVSIVLGGVGSLLGVLVRRRAERAAQNWLSRFAVVAATTVFLLLITGGLVTGWQAGLAVPDWPGTFGHNMFLYPVAEMTGGRFYEHAHRLYGSLVGVTALALTVAVWRGDRRGWVRVVALAVLAAVVAQGVMGGLRVTEALTGETGIEISESEHETTVSGVLRVVHGVFGQIVFAMMALLAAFTSEGWRRPSTAKVEAEKEPTDYRRWFDVLALALVVQLTLGATFRHFQPAEDPLTVAGFLHLGFAMFVFVQVLACTAIAWGALGRWRVFRRLGQTLAGVFTLQFLLGAAALTAVLLRSEGPNTVEVVVTTAHQAVGALLLAVAALLCAWSRREAG